MSRRSDRGASLPGLAIKTFRRQSPGHHLKPPKSFSRILALGLSLFSLAFSGACDWLAPARLSEPERQRLAHGIKQEIQRLVGEQVWVKTPPYAPFPPRRAGDAAEVVVASHAFDRTLKIIEQHAQREALGAKTRIERRRERWRLAEIRLTRGRAPAGRWLLREVPRLRRAAIVIDDLGQDLDAAQKLLALGYPFTFAVLPYLRHSAATAEEAHRAGCEVMLHLPMEPLPNDTARPGQGEIRVGMSPLEVVRTLETNLDSVPHVRGVNNHMGSRATTHAALMASVMRALEARRLYFVDSRTTGATVAFDVARREGIPTFYRSVFLDDTQTAAYTLRQLREFLRVIKEQDVALAIGHPYPSTVTALTQFLPEFERQDIQLVPVSQLLELSQVARLSPPRAATP